MKFCTVFLMAGLAYGVLAQPIYRFDLLADSNKVGTASMSFSATEQGGRQVKIEMEMRAAGSVVTVRSETIHSATGSPIRQILETVTDRQSRVLKVTDFNLKGAVITQTADGKVTKKTVEVSPQAPRENSSVFWFVKSRPKVSDKAVFYHFDPNREEWSLRETVYLGKSSIKVGDKSFSGHKIQTSAGMAILDDGGVPFVMDMGPSIRLVRTGVDQIAPNGKLKD